jgi:hypothetical protein
LTLTSRSPRVGAALESNRDGRLVEFGHKQIQSASLAKLAISKAAFFNGVITLERRCLSKHDSESGKSVAHKFRTLVIAESGRIGIDDACG